jgi:CspA family cold shock protein
VIQLNHQAFGRAGSPHFCSFDTLADVTDEAIARGWVKFFNPEKGWGGIESPELPHDVWVHYSTIAGQGYRSLEEGERVEFAYEDCAGHQDSWHFRTLWVRRLPL